MLRLPGRSWWPNEQPSLEIKEQVEHRLDQLDWKVDIVLSHTVPLKYEPVEVFLPGLDQQMVDKSTEEWLNSIEQRLQYSKWYAGHFHTAKKIEKLELLFENYTTI